MKEQQILKARILCKLECTSTICTPSRCCNFKSSTSWQSQGSAYQMQPRQNLLCAHPPASPSTSWVWICLPKMWAAEMPTLNTSVRKDGQRDNQSWSAGSHTSPCRVKRHSISFTILPELLLHLWGLKTAGKEPTS